MVTKLFTVNICISVTEACWGFIYLHSSDSVQSIQTVKAINYGG